MMQNTQTTATLCRCVAVRMAEKEKFSKKCLTKGGRRGIIYKLSTREAGIRHREASRNFFKKDFKKVLTSVKRCGIIVELSMRVGCEIGH